MPIQTVQLSAQRIARIAMGTALITICAWLTVPAVVAFTMQTFGIFCVLGLLGGRDGSVAVLLYLLLGGVGVPVFSGMRGGLQVLTGTTGGYLIGFLWMSLFYWLCMRLCPERIQKKIWLNGVLLGIGLLFCYAFGTAWFVVVSVGKGSATTILQAMKWCVFPFLLPDLFKLSLSLYLVAAIRKRIPTFS